MSKFFCEICGTAYSDSAKVCPICGSPKSASAEFSVETTENSDSENRRVPVKGGRFSKENVAKRLNNESKPEPIPVQHDKPKKKSNKKQNKKGKKNSTAERVLLIVIIFLLAAIAAVVAYIIINYFVPNSEPAPTSTQPIVSTTPATTETTEATEPSTIATEPLEVPCTGLTLTEESIRFNEVGKTWLLNVVVTPANTTDEITFKTSDPAVATVDADGRVTAVGNGSCIITVECGGSKVECQVVCEIPQETEPTETTQPVDLSDFKLNRVDFTLMIGEYWLLYEGDIDPADIVWTSSNPRVATVANGLVKGIAKGMCTITAEYMGVTLECVVYVR